MKLQKSLRVRVALLVLFAASSCQTAPAARTSAPPSLPRGYVPATRSTDECGAARMRTATLPAGTMDGLQLPIVRGFPLPPSPLGRKAEGKLLVTLRVDEAGRPVRDSIFVTGKADAPYVREFIRGLRTERFWPAVLDGCNVAARWSMTVDLGPQR
jgi:hypothetical protein